MPAKFHSQPGCLADWSWAGVRWIRGPLRGRGQRSRGGQGWPGPPRRCFRACLQHAHPVTLLPGREILSFLQNTRLASTWKIPAAAPGLSGAPGPTSPRQVRGCAAGPRGARGEGRAAPCSAQPVRTRRRRGRGWPLAAGTRPARGGGAWRALGLGPRAAAAQGLGQAFTRATLLGAVLRTPAWRSTQRPYYQLCPTAEGL